MCNFFAVPRNVPSSKKNDDLVDVDESENTEDEDAEKEDSENENDPLSEIDLESKITIG